MERNMSFIMAILERYSKYTGPLAARLAEKPVHFN